jgi:hypothetical protein
MFASGALFQQEEKPKPFVREVEGKQRTILSSCHLVRGPRQPLHTASNMISTGQFG